MNSIYSANLEYAKTVIDLEATEFSSLIESADAFICAAGFEQRARQVPLAANVRKNPLIVGFSHGAKQNDETYKLLAGKFERVPGFDVCELNLVNPEKFEFEFEKHLRKLKDLETGHIVLDISALTNFAICIAIMKIRQAFPMASLTVLYTEAEEYFPRKKDFESFKKTPFAVSSFLSEKAVNMFMPSMFSGVTLGQNDTCLIIFAGYEPHRTNCSIEAMNPNRLVMVYGEPERPDLKWRLDMSKILHCRVDDQMMKTDEIRSTSDIGDNLRLLLQYYEYLYDDNVICVSPTNSKMQAIASALAWETYPDIQLNFPIPTEYLPTRFSIKSRDTFAIELGLSPRAQQWKGSQTRQI
jgi:hypothetical protein